MMDSYKIHPTWARGYGVWLTVSLSTLIMSYMKIKIKISISTMGQNVSWEIDYNSYHKFKHMNRSQTEEHVVEITI
jgi:hypothetical protein